MLRLLVLLVGRHTRLPCGYFEGVYLKNACSFLNGQIAEDLCEHTNFRRNCGRFRVASTQDFLPVVLRMRDYTPHRVQSIRRRLHVHSRGGWEATHYRHRREREWGGHSCYHGHAGHTLRDLVARRQLRAWTADPVWWHGGTVVAADASTGVGERMQFAPAAEERCDESSAGEA
jgi:hypothetical protein